MPDTICGRGAAAARRGGGADQPEPHLHRHLPADRRAGEALVRRHRRRSAPSARSPRSSGQLDGGARRSSSGSAGTIRSCSIPPGHGAGVTPGRSRRSEWSMRSARRRGCALSITLGSEMRRAGVVLASNFLRIGSSQPSDPPWRAVPGTSRNLSRSRELAVGADGELSFGDAWVRSKADSAAARQSTPATHSPSIADRARSRFSPADASAALGSPWIAEGTYVFHGLQPAQLTVWSRRGTPTGRTGRRALLCTSTLSPTSRPSARATAVDGRPPLHWPPPADDAARRSMVGVRWNRAGRRAGVPDFDDAQPPHTGGRTTSGTVPRPAAGDHRPAAGSPPSPRCCRRTVRRR